MRASARWLRLELVVELLVDALADLPADRRRRGPGRPLHEAQDHPEVLHVRPDGLGDARVLDLHRDLAAVVQRRGRPGRSRRRRSGPRRTRRRPASFSPSSASTTRASRGRTPSARRRAGGELRLELVAELLGHEATSRRTSPARASSRRPSCPERRHDLLGGLDLAALDRILAASSSRVRFAARVATWLGPAGGEPPDLGRAREPRGRDVVLRPSWRYQGGLASSPTWDPGTMSSRPSGQRTHALCPPS